MTMLQSTIDKADSFSVEDWMKYVVVDAHVDVLIDMRKHMLRFSEVCSSTKPSLSELFQVDINKELNVFNGMFNFDITQLTKSCTFLQDNLRDLWGVALAKQSEVVESASCPGWTSHLHDLLEQPKIIESLVCNPDYGTLHTANELLMKNLRLLSKINKDFSSLLFETDLLLFSCAR